MRFVYRSIGLLFVMLAVHVPAGNAQTAAITGRVVTPDGASAPDATVSLAGARQRSRVDASGIFEFSGLRAGDYLVEARSPRFGIATAAVAAVAGDTVEVDLVLDRLFHAEPITVTAGPGARGLEEVAQPVQVLAGQQLTARREMTLGETLSKEPGVNSTFFGPGASRPVIRGLGGDRIRILEGGVGTGDASSTSPDHAIGHDPLSAERIEIVRGAATLLYGSSAIGGVVNVIDERIPRFTLDTPATGSIELRGATVDEEKSAGLSLSGGAGNVAWHVGGLARDTDDYTADEATLFNSDAESSNLTGGLSLVGERGFVGFALSRFDTEYGIPVETEVAVLEQAQEEEEGPVRIDLDQRRFDLEGEFDARTGFFKGVRARLGVADYEHVELVEGEVGTRFTNDEWEARIEIPHAPVGIVEGAFGVQLGSREFTAIGDEAFVPPTDTDRWAVFAFEEIPVGDTKLQFGARYENADVGPLGEPGEGALVRDRSLDGVSASVGVVVPLASNFSFSSAIARAVKLPSTEELFSNGPHEATESFEIGDPDLENETSIGIDVGIGRDAGPVRGEVNFFYNRFDDFIFQAFTDDIEDGLPVLLYAQQDATFTGLEGHLDIELFHREPHHLSLELSGDYVRAELDRNDEPAPRIPPLRIGATIAYQGDAWWGRFGARRVNEQDRVARFETPTDGYTMTDLQIGYRFVANGFVHDIVFRGSNLGDTLARNHVSLIKDRSPLPGRDFSLAYRLHF